jgi:hypothetical protein
LTNGFAARGTAKPNFKHTRKTGTGIDNDPNVRLSLVRGLKNETVSI